MRPAPERGGFYQSGCAQCGPGQLVPDNPSYEIEATDDTRPDRDPRQRPDGSTRDRFGVRVTTNMHPMQYASLIDIGCEDCHALPSRKRWGSPHQRTPPAGDKGSSTPRRRPLDGRLRLSAPPQSTAFTAKRCPHGRLATPDQKNQWRASCSRSRPRCQSSRWQQRPKGQEWCTGATSVPLACRRTRGLRQ